MMNDINDNFNKHYWRSFGYMSDPFADSLTAEPYISSTWNELLDVLPQFSRYCHALVLVTGTDKIGKTTLVNLFVEEEQNNVDLIYLNADKCSGVEFLLELLHDRYDAPYDPKSNKSTSEQLEEQLDFLKLNKKPRLLIIDNAHDLPLDMRQACLQIVQQQTALETCLPVILIGNESLEQQYLDLLTPTTAKECLHIIHVAGLNVDETADYLIWACEKVGGDKNTSPFSQEDVETIHQATNGQYAKINHAARNLLSTRKNKKTTHISPAARKKIIWWMCTLIVIIALLYVYKYLTQPKNLQTTFTKPIPMRKEDKNNIYQTGNLQVHQKENVQTTPPANMEHINNLHAIIPKVSSAPSNKPVSNKPVSNKPVINKPISNKPVAKAPVANDLFSEVMQEKLAIERKRVLAVNPNQYTLQLLAAQNLHAVQKFIAQHQLQATAMIVETYRKHQLWYLVIYGIFPSHAAAKNAIIRVEPQIKSLNPWIRTYKSVHQEMSKTS